MDHSSVLDEMVSEDSVQLLKAAFPYLPAQGQSFVSVFAKFLELQNTLRLFHGNSGAVNLCAQSAPKASPLEMLTACSSVCQGRTKEQLDQMINTLAMLQMLELSPKNFSNDQKEKGESCFHESFRQSERKTE